MQPMLPYDLQNCADEPIHLPESVQPYGYLLAVDPASGRITRFSANLGQLFNAPVAPGSSLGEWVSDWQNLAPRLQQTYERLRQEGRRSTFELRLDSAKLAPGQQGSTHECVAYASGAWLVLELESTAAWRPEAIAQTRQVYLQTALPEDLATIGSLREMAAQIAARVRAISGYDRVMVYQLDADNNGEVIGEARRDDLEPFHGLHFPAADIPAQARRLYEINWIRMIFDIDAKPVALLPAAGETGADPLDLSLSLVRSVSPIHLRYLRNMGVQATMSISLLKGGRLWGLIACHHYSPRYLPQGLRLDCELLGQLYSWQLNTKEAELASKARIDRVDLVDRLVESLALDERFSKSLKHNGAPLLRLMNANGFVLNLGETQHTVGEVPEAHQVNALVDTMTGSGSGELACSHKLHQEFPQFAELERFAGAMVVPINLRHRYYAVWFRPQLVYTIDWAGRESVVDKSKLDTAEERLRPRGSFELWSQTVEGESQPWRDDDIAVAQRFNRLLVMYLVENKVSAEQSLLKMRELDQAKDQFLASISHELRSPLNAILGWAELALYSRNDSSKAYEALEVIQRSAKTQAVLINDLLDLSRIVSGTLKLSVHTVNIGQLVYETCEIFHAALQAKDIRLTIAAGGELSNVLGDPVRLKQILTNLISNSLKFTPKGGSITVGGRRVESNFVLTVEDTGKGIAEQELPRIFERFYQPERAHGKQGLGLGLAIVKNLVELHGGEISVSSEVGRGTRFEVSFPIAPLKHEVGDLPQPSTGSGAGASDQRLQGLRILIAEDEPDANRFICLFLTRHGASVTSVTSGLEAWHELERTGSGYDLLLSDIGMPELDGYQLIRQIRASGEPEIRDCRAIALTAYAYSSDRVKALKSGFTSYVAKPVDPEELLTVIESVCLN